jgi:hypothetical protein
MTRPAYKSPGPLQIQDSSGKLVSLDQWRRDYAPSPDQIAKPDVVADWIAAGLIASAFGAVALSVFALVRVFEWVGLLVGGGS